MTSEQKDKAVKVVVLVALVLLAGTILGVLVQGCQNPRTRTEAVPQPRIVVKETSPEVAKGATPGGAVTEVPLPDNRVLRVPAGHSVSVEYAGGGKWEGGSSYEESHGTASGVGQRAVGDSLDANLSSESPELGMGEFFARGGASKMSLKAIGSSKVSWVIMAGVVLLAGGIVVWIWMKQAALGMALVVAGVAVLVVAFYPGLLLAAGIAGLAILVLVMYAAWKKKRDADAATAAVVGVEAGNTIGPADLKLSIDAKDYAKAQQIIDATIAAVKAKIQAASEKKGGVMAKFLGK